MGNDYNNFDSAEEYNAYYEKVCKQIAENIQEHYKDFDIKFVEVATNENEQRLEERVDSLQSELNDLRFSLTEVLLKAPQAKDYNSLVDILEELNKILNNH